jgi:diguanylate cyclase (GGDEF)-like protein/PAS domain S-box-containing protein
MKDKLLIEHDYTLMDSLSGELLLFRTLWSTSDDNMFIVHLDSEGDFVSEATNAAQEKMFHLQAHQLDGKKLKDILDAATYKTIAKRYRQCIELSKPITYDEVFFLNGSERFWSTTILPVIDEKEGTTKIFGISREFTQLKNIEKELQRVNETLEAQVKERTHELTQALEKLKEASMTDSLTGLFNRTQLDESLKYQIKYCKRYKEEFGLILIDIDYFKDVNDQFGHQVGDTVLIEFANLLKSNTRETDIVARWGGEEFFIICPKSNRDDTNLVAENLQKKIEAFGFTKVKHKTASFGVTVFRDNDSFNGLIKRVDDALYQSKENGRNCITTQ